MRGRTRRYYAQAAARDDFFQSARSDFALMIKRGSFVLLAAAICMVIVATNAPQLRELQKLEAELEEVHGLEQETLESFEEVRSRREAIQNDEEYFLLVARDELDRALPGETIIRVERR